MFPPADKEKGGRRGGRRREEGRLTSEYWKKLTKAQMSRTSSQWEGEGHACVDSLSGEELSVPQTE